MNSAEKGTGVFCAKHPKGRSGPSTVLRAALRKVEGRQKTPVPFFGLSLRLWGASAASDNRVRHLEGRVRVQEAVKEGGG